VEGDPDAVGEKVTSETKTKEYIRPMPATWWLHNYHLVLFMVRELTSLFVAGYAIFLLVLLYFRFSNQEAAFSEVLKSPVSIVCQVIALAFVVFHSVTWFNLTPKAVILWRGEEKVSPAVIAGAHYALWAVVSLIILFLVAVA
jgi:fumarate reductase subunit C